ncbi:apolipoprotein lipid transfer particle [Arctopsyche grandis]|uniref:apolipoprotein lipid transfer particle n=1 Tax=Arctopsyche grandis TaxID=121162 RepID=UPI00406D7124
MCVYSRTVILCIFVLVTCFMTISNGNTLRDPYICGQPTCNTIDKFKYSKYISYHYNYSVTINTVFEGSSENRSTLNVDASVVLEFITECEALLKINSVRMKDQDEDFLQEREGAFANKLSEHSLRFAFHNGMITEICPQEKEEDWALNFKRGVLSLFQNSMSRFDMDFNGIERDIHGSCNTDYRMEGQQNTSLIILKKKDLTECIDRYKYLSILQTVRYNFQSKFQTWPVLQSESRCRIVIDHKIYTLVQCRERHLFEPFSGKQSGAMTTVFQNLVLAGEMSKSSDSILDEKNEELEIIMLRQDLLHNHISIPRPSIGVLKSARDILKQLCKIEVQAESETMENSKNSEAEQVESGIMVRLWGEFVRACRGLQYTALSQLYARADAICPLGKKHIIDALPYIASVGSVELIKDMILKKSVSAEVRQEWLMSMAMIPRPHKEKIFSMGELLKANPLDKYISLAASVMVHSYCRNSKKLLSECCLETQNANIIKIFEDNVLESLSTNKRNFTRNERENLVISIKALGNIGGFTNNFRDTALMSIINDDNFDIQIRLYAVDAFRRTPCEETRSYFLQIFKQKFVDVEVRLASYLQVMRCPRYVLIREIIQILRQEEINQVSSFVWSHLENLGKSTIPSRLEKQGFLSGNTIPIPKNTLDIRKFSRNFEYGVFFDDFNAGGNCEANIIMSPDTYIPRSLSLNLTLDMFGESINIFEMKARGEGFEDYIESIFGPNGQFGRSTVDNKLKSLRVLRSANDEASSIKRKIKNINYKNEALNHRFPILDLGIKVFGNEISYWNAEGDEEIKSTVTQLNPLHHINKILSGKEIDYKKASLFLDTTYSVPTGCGLPMTMNLLGTNIVNLKMSGSISNTDTFFQTRNLDFEGKMHPSMALNVAATMSVSAGGLGDTGIRVNFRLHTSTALSAKLKLRSGTLASLNVSLPHSKQEIFEAKSELIVLHGNKEVRQVSFNKNKVEASTCSWTIIDKAIGIKLCASYEFPNMTNVGNAPYFIMAGPAHYLLSLEKVDPTAKVYSFLYAWNTNDTTNDIRFSFDTPNSLTKRSIDSSVTYSKEFGTAVMTFQSADNFLKAHATYKNLANLKLLECALDIDGQKHFDAVMSINKQDQKNGYVLIPKLYLAVNNDRITELAGTLKFAQKKGVSQCDVSMEFQTKKLASRLIGYVTWNGPSKGTKLRLDYQFLNERKETIRFDGLISNRELPVRKDFYGELGLQFSSYPHLNFFTDAKYMGTPNHIDFNLNLSSSRELKDESGTFQYSFSRHRTLDGFKLQHYLKVNKPYLDTRFQYEEDGALQLVSATATYDKVQHSNSMVGLWGRLYFPLDTRLYLEAGLNITLPRFVPFVFKTHIYEKKSNEIDINAECIWFTGTDASLVALYQDQSSSNLASRRLKAILTSTKFTEILIEAKYTQDNKQISINTKANQGEDEYGLMGRYIIYSERNFSCYGQLELKSKIYSVNVIADLKNDTNILTDIHLDQLRDIHLTYSKINTENLKKLSADINWDANRDPNQKLSVELQLLNRGTLNYGGMLQLFYPGRMINGEFDFHVKDWLCMWLLKLGWSPDDSILWRVKVYSEMEKETTYALLSEMDTPFNGWRDTSFNLMWRFVDNLQELNANMTWEKERVIFNVLGDYLLKTNEVYGELSALINSTLPTLPNAAAIARHRHHWRKSSDTLMSFEYNNEGMLMINSSWKIDRSSSANNISGRVALKSPFQGYKNGLLVTTFMVNQKRDIQGLTHLNLEEKIYTISVEGHTRRFTNSMFTINVTSPIPSYSLMVARFGFIDTDRHLVALIETPNITIGAELLLKLISSKDFHVYGHLAIPIEFLQNVKVRAKRNLEEVDFRLGFEKLELGFTGIWQYTSKLNFKYVYKIYTPLEAFKENGFVLKNVYKDGLDSEISVKLSKHKLGIALNIKDNEKGLLKIIEEKYMGIQKKDFNQLIEDFSSDILITLDTLYFDTIHFKANLKKVEGEMEEEIFTIQANLLLPNGSMFILTDKFVLEDFTTMRNDFHLITPFKELSEIKYIHTVEIVLHEKYNISALIFVKEYKNWQKNSFHIMYELETGDYEGYANHVAVIDVDTQLEILKSINGKISILIDDSISKISANIELPSCYIAATGQIEVDESFINIEAALNLTSPYLQPYTVRVNFKKDFTDVESLVKGGLQIQQGSQNNYLAMELAWHANKTDHLRLKARCSLIPIIPPSDMAVEFGMASDRHRVLRVEAHVGSKDNLYSLNAEQHGGTTALSILSPLRGFRNINFTGEVNSNQIITGVFQGDVVTYKVNGNISGENPLKLVATFQPRGDGESYSIQLQSSTNQDRYYLTATLISTIQFYLHVNFQDGKTFKDLSVKVDSSTQHFEEIYFKSRIDLLPDGRVLLNVQAATPLKKLKRLNANTDVMLTSKTGAFLCTYNATNLHGFGNFKWSLLAENIYIRAMSQHTVNDDKSSLDLNSYYTSVEAASEPTEIGFHVNIDDAWKIGANTSLQIIANKEATAIFNVLFPKPNTDVHTIKVNVDYDKEQTQRSFDIRYMNDVDKFLALASAKVKLPLNILNANVTLAKGLQHDLEVIENLLDIRILGNNSFGVDYTLSTPLFNDQETFKLKGKYDNSIEEFVVLDGMVHYPGSIEISNLDITYGGMKHTVGKFNSSTPFKNLPWLAADIRISNKEMLSENIIELFWTNDTALLNSTHKVQENGDSVVQSGVVAVEFPLSTRHFLIGDYNYHLGKSWSKGNVKMYHNSKQFVDGNFKKATDLGEKDLIRDTVDMDINNEFSPVGIHYVHQYDSSGNIDIKEASIYDLNNSTSFNLTGRIDIESWKAGKQIKIMTIHGERTLRFQNNFELLEKELFQSSKLEWASDVWLQYDVFVQNKTIVDDESQELNFNIRYPGKELGLVAFYNLKETLLDGTAILNWALSNDNKTVKIRGKWESPELVDRNQQNFIIILSHPSFKKDVTLSADYVSDITSTSNISAVLEYSDFENERLVFQSILKDNSNGPIRDYKFKVDCKHPATNLDLEFNGDLYLKYKYYYLNNYYKYKKSLFNEIVRHGKILLDLNNHKIQLEETRDEDWRNFIGKWEAVYPEYNIHFTLNKTNGNDTGIFLISGKDKHVLGHFNRTADISYHLIGQINDARSADLIAWRDFEDVKTIDIVSYIQLNHSRLLSGKIGWRPEMYQQIKGSITQSLRDVYSHTSEILLLIKTIPMEVHEALKNVWSDARPRVKDLLTDLNDLHVIKDDIDEFHIFLNESYDANEFYVKNIVEFTMNIIDQLSLRNQIESLPGMVKELWQLMGDTGTSLRESILWIIDTIKSSHGQLVERINKLLEADFMDQVSDFIEAGILKYDSFVKQLHLSFIHYCETTWANASAKLKIFWTNFLKTIEPTYLQLAHYIETFVYQFGQEILDFFYARTYELTETPFFSKLTELSRDIDIFVKDMQNNDAITNIKKYTDLVVIFFKEKVLVHIPFHKEFQVIAQEIWDELNHLQELSLVVHIKAKFWEAKERLQWWYDYFKIGEALKSIAYTLYHKITEMPRTAIQNEEKHRIPKTNFIFDPREGLLLLEQKLPMPWHAFNRTPDFTEVPEYKVVKDLVDTWFLSNTSFMSYYYAYKQYMDIYTLIPPFTGQAVITGHGTIVTFDRKVFTVNEPGTFLLLSDFLQSNFSILIKSESHEEYNLVLLAESKLIEIDLFSKALTISQGGNSSILPVKVENWVIHRNEEYITINNVNGVEITCDFLYKTCTINVEGWYFSRLGGLLGTMNNEPFDDMMTPERKVVPHVEFLNSWMITNNRFTSDSKKNINKQDSVCEDYFKTKISSLKACFPMIDAEPFYEECMNGLDPCVLANAYKELCMFNHIPIRIPNKCMECKSPTGKILEEGTFSDIKDIQNATDVVFLVEAHICNENIRKERNIDMLVNTLETKLSENGFSNNRYSIVGFGGEGVFKTPHSLYINNKVFVSASEISTFFDYIETDSKPVGNTSHYNSDTFEAFNVASKMNFRPGVSKTFILFPCTRCDVSFMKLDYTVVHQVLMDSSITLHIIMDDEFKLNKKRIAKNLYGIDNNYAYTSKDVKELVGDAKLRQQIRLPKTKLGFCASLAIETNGTVFSGNKMRSTEPGGGKKAAVVLGARAAQSSKPCLRARCECNMARLKCSVCPRFLSRNPIDDISLSMWESSEIEDFIDNFLDMPITTI